MVKRKLIIFVNRFKVERFFYLKKMSKMMEKAKELFEKHGYNLSNELCNSMITEFQAEWNQEKIDFWLDVKNELKKYQK